MIGFDIYELNDNEAFWTLQAIEQQINDVLQIIEKRNKKGMELLDYPEILQSLQNAHRKLKARYNCG
ncbi:MAG: hypothetical protein SFU27_02040 [Thermonemataceae bacterium]|nr:hypothetical protein [Thermonemataceae bacterium]